MKKGKIILSTILISLVATLIVFAGEAGSDSDPLVSKSYLDAVIMPQVSQKTTFSVVEVNKGKTIYGESGTEMIIRQGGGTIVATEAGGICDSTVGTDLSNKTTAPSNHLLIIPVGDGRGIKTNAYTLVMVKGGYSIK